MFNEIIIIRYRAVRNGFQDARYPMRVYTRIVVGKSL